MRTALTFAALLLAPAAASAQGSVQATTRAELVKKLGVGFEQADKNNDDFLSRAEVQAAEQRALQEASKQLTAKLRQQFQQLDKDKNGQLSFAEFRGLASVKANPNASAVALQRLDANRDGKISRNEYAGRALKMFDQIDTNKDGKISADEMKRAQAKK